VDNWQIIILTLLLSAFFSGMEIAFVSSNRLRIELDLKKNLLSARILSRFYKNPSHFIGALLFGNNVALVVYGIAMANVLKPAIVSWLPESIYSNFSLLLLQTVISTILVLIVAEFLPKIFFRINPNGLLNAFSVPVYLIYYAFYPIIVLYIGISELILKSVLRIELTRSDYRFSSVDLNDYLKEYAQQEESEDDVQHDIQLFQNAIEFRHVKLRECMVPRTEIEAVSSNATMAELRHKFAETKHSKILIYSDNIDNIVGYVHSFDMFKNPMSISEIIREIQVYPETFAANRLLNQFIQDRQGIALVLDEFGGTSGIVSMEDIIEEIFGEIDDEFDEDSTIEKKLGDNEYIFSTRLEIDYLNETYKLGFPEAEDYETLAGFILHYHESIPEDHEEVIIHPYKIKVLKATENRLDEVHLKLLED
jgi:putative hemolysin